MNEDVGASTCTSSGAGSYESLDSYSATATASSEFITPSYDYSPENVLIDGATQSWVSEFSMGPKTEYVEVDFDSPICIDQAQTVYSVWGYESSFVGTVRILVDGAEVGSKQINGNDGFDTLSSSMTESRNIQNIRIEADLDEDNGYLRVYYVKIMP
jgi:hypothetical protein